MPEGSPKVVAKKIVPLLPRSPVKKIVVKKTAVAEAHQEVRPGLQESGYVSALVCL
jgi:hypothetical protein